MSKTNRRRRSGKKEKETQSMLFGEDNYKLIVLGLVLIIAGFAAMYIENKVNGFISLYISPVVIVAGYAEIIYAIMKPNKKLQDGTQS
ncbi:MAG TPA: hypothetical protein VKA34_03400 [Balneolales bacterium]|nr:hypothetical protein [Balneolales bacterium]